MMIGPTPVLLQELTEDLPSLRAEALRLGAGTLVVTGSGVVELLVSGSATFYPLEIIESVVEHEDRVYLVGLTPERGFELMSIAPDDNGPRLVHDTPPRPASSDPLSAHRRRRRSLLLADDGVPGSEV